MYTNINIVPTENTFEQLFFNMRLVQDWFNGLSFNVRFSMECRRTKTTLITLANHK